LGTSATDSDSHDSLGFRNSDANNSSILQEVSDSNYRQLREIVQRMRSGPSGPKDVDGAYDLFIKFRERASSLCVAILQDEFRPIRNPSNLTDIMMRRDSSVESPNAMFDHRSSFSGRSLSEVVTGSGGRSTHHGEQSLNAIREWKLYLESLAEWFKTNLADTYRKFEPDATADKVEALFTNKRFRKEAVYRMRNASVTRVMSADPQFVSLTFTPYQLRTSLIMGAIVPSLRNTLSKLRKSEAGAD
jgi:hypothetical protein